MTLLSPLSRTTPGLEDLVTAIRAVVSSRGDWPQTARRAAEALRGQLPSPEVLTGAQRGAPEDPRSRLMHAEPDGTFSILAIVWRPGQVTRIHDHVTWCVFGWMASSPGRTPALTCRSARAGSGSTPG